MVNYEYHDKIIIGIGENLECFPHLHSEMEFLYITSGEVIVTVDGHEILMKQGDVAAVFPNVIHSFKSNNENTFIYTVFRCEYAPFFEKRLLSNQSPNPFFHDDEGAFYQVFSDLKKCHLEKKLDMVSVFLSYMCAIAFEEVEIRPWNFHELQDWLPNVLLHITRHYREKINLESISKFVGVSKFYLSRGFSKRVGLGINEYIKGIRVENAGRLIKSTNRPITEICYECGFDNTRTFNRCFKEVYHMTPREFRNELVYIDLS